MKHKLILIILFLGFVVPFFYSCESDSGGYSQTTVNAYLPDDYQKVFFLQNFNDNSVDEILKSVKYFVVSVEGPGIDKPIVKTGKVGRNSDLLVPAGKNRLFAVALMNKEKEVVFAGYKMVDYLPKGKEITVDIQLHFARSFTDSTRDYYPAGSTGAIVYDLRDVMLTWGKDEEGKKVVNLFFTFNRKVSLLRGEGGKGLMGIIEIDSDGNPTTGVPSFVDSLRPESEGKIGVDYILYIEGFEKSKALLVNAITGDYYYLPLKIVERHIMLSVPMRALKLLNISSIFYLDSAFISFDGNDRYVDIFPDGNAAVSNNLFIPPVYNKADALKIGDFEKIYSYRLPTGVDVDFSPFQSGNIFGGIASMEYPSSQSVEIRSKVFKIYRVVSNYTSGNAKGMDESTTFERSVDTLYGTSSVNIETAAKGNVIAVTASGFNMESCSGGPGIKVYISFDGGYSYKAFENRWCLKGSLGYENSFPLLQFSNNFLYAIAVTYPERYGGTYYRIRKYELSPAGLKFVKEYPVVSKELSAPLAIGDDFYMSEITVESSDVKLVLKNIENGNKIYSESITKVSSNSSIYLDSLKRWGDYFLVTISDYGNSVNYSESILTATLKYSKENNEILVLRKMLAPEGYYPEGVFPVNENGRIGGFYYYEGSTGGFYYLDGSSKILVTSPLNSFKFNGFWLIPPGVPVVFWKDSLDGKIYTFHIAIGVPGSSGGKLVVGP